jgi:hypothetical protein
VMRWESFSWLLFSQSTLHQPDRYDAKINYL